MTVSRILLIMVLAIGMGACASSGNEIAKSDRAGATAAESSKPKKRCYRERSTGTNLGTRICKEVHEASGH